MHKFSDRHPAATALLIVALVFGGAVWGTHILTQMGVPEPLFKIFQTK